MANKSASKIWFMTVWYFFAANHYLIMNKMRYIYKKKAEWLHILNRVLQHMILQSVCKSPFSHWVCPSIGWILPDYPTQHHFWGKPHFWVLLIFEVVFILIWLDFWLLTFDFFHDVICHDVIFHEVIFHDLMFHTSIFHELIFQCHISWCQWCHMSWSLISLRHMSWRHM